jgi:uncharacterized membrane protein
VKGSILGFDRDTHAGAISGHDGQRYEFVRLDWRGGGEPVRGRIVDFVPDGRRATQIYPLGLRGDPIEGDDAKAVYILYLVSLVIGITGIVGLVMAYVNRADSPEWVQTHFRFQIRTFWIGLLYIVVSAALAIIVVGIVTGVLTVIWLIMRCVKGMQALARGEAYPEPATWLW